MNDLATRKEQLLAESRERFSGGNLLPGECPICGFDVSSHGVSSYGLDCPWSSTPSKASREGRLPSRR